MAKRLELTSSEVGILLNIASQQDPATFENDLTKAMIHRAKACMIEGGDWSLYVVNG